jgi:hypothetical protein
MTAVAERNGTTPGAAAVALTLHNPVAQELEHDGASVSGRGRP